MNKLYKELMEQHGGSIPFSDMPSITGRSNNRMSNNRRSSNRRTTNQRGGNKLKTTRKTIQYKPGTIIRMKGQLYRVNNSQKWSVIKV